MLIGLSLLVSVTDGVFPGPNLLRIDSCDSHNTG